MKLFFFLLTTIFTSLAFAGDEKNASVDSSVLQNIKLSDNFKGFALEVSGGYQNTDSNGDSSPKIDGVSQTGIATSTGLTTSGFDDSDSKRINNNFRLELEFSQRDELEYDAKFTSEPSVSKGVRDKADIDTKSVFINGFYDFESFVISNTSVTPYLGGGIV